MNQRLAKVVRAFEKIDYALRPAKNIERKMMCEALGRLARIAPLITYRYIGFGSIGFYDFALFHQRLGISEMLSIEGCADAKQRVEFNRPYSCVNLHWGMSHEVLPTLTWTKRSIVWLDYDGPLEMDVLDDITTVVARARSGSVLIVTARADPKDADEGQDHVATKRLELLRSRVGKASVPSGVTGKALAKWGFARVCRQIINNRIEETLFNRNGATQAAKKLRYLQLFNYHYADGAKMLTVGGLLVNARDELRAGFQHFKDLDFARNGDEPYLIEIPILTRREIRLLNESLPKSAPAVALPRWLPSDERKKYGRVYRYFPAFSEVES
jgi:hypothetical protein